MLAGTKVYQVKGKLGETTMSMDLGEEHPVFTYADYSHVTKEMLNEKLKDFVGETMQTPPMYSALHKDGKRLYELAREGKTVDVAPRRVRVYDIECVDWSPPHFELALISGRGFYVRKLIYDVGIALNTLAVTTRLVRIRQGPFKLDDCPNNDTLSREVVVRELAKWKVMYKPPKNLSYEEYLQEKKKIN